MRLYWTTPAAEDLYRIYSRRQSHRGGRCCQDDLRWLWHARELSSPWPRRPDPRTRELIFSGLPYIVVYEIKEQNVEILRIYHGAQDWP